jgi:hypothetical protein
MGMFFFENLAWGSLQRCTANIWHHISNNGTITEKKQMPSQITSAFSQCKCGTQVGASQFALLWGEFEFQTGSRSPSLNGNVERPTCPLKYWI